MRRRAQDSNLPAPRIALIVGGSGGIGSAIVRSLQPVCEKVFFTYGRSRESAEAMSDEFSSCGGARLIPIHVDLTDEEAWSRKLDVLIEEGPIDLLVNAAGVSADALCIDVTRDALIEQYQVNVFAAWRAMVVLGRDMAFHRRGRIINITSIAATVNSPGRSVYASTKAALVSLTKSFAVELGRFGIRVNAVAPGFVSTEMIGDFSELTKEGFLSQIPLGRFALAAEVAHLVRFLTTPEASYLHGSILTIDGGTTA